MRSVNWDEPTEQQHALELIKYSTPCDLRYLTVDMNFSEWSPIEAEDALELLSPAVTQPEVRGYAVSRLFDAASGDQILLFLPQLVQVNLTSFIMENIDYFPGTQIRASKRRRDYSRCDPC